MDRKDLPADLSLDAFGRVMLPDSILDKIDHSVKIATVGTNSGACNGTTNSGCTNSQFCTRTDNNYCLNQLLCSGVNRSACGRNPN